MKALKFLSIAAAAAIAIAPQLASAESTAVTGAGNATARLNFKVVIPRVLFLQVGSGTLGSSTTVDTIQFSPTAADILSATSNLAGTGGDQTAGVVTVRVFANTGNVDLSAAGSNTAGNGSGMQLGAATTYIPWTEIVPTAAAGTTASGFTGTSIAHPTIGTGSTTLTASGGVVKQVGKWTFQYKNQGSYAPGTYDGTVTYTASAP